MQYEKVKDLIADTKSQGYKFALPPQTITSGEGFFLTPIIVDNPPATSRIVTEEQFGTFRLSRIIYDNIQFDFPRLHTNIWQLGPIVPVLKWTDELDVIARANGTTSGLGASVWSSDVARAERVGRLMEAGSVFVNSWAKTTPRAMLSGHKESGLGGEWGSTGFLEYCNNQVVHVFK